MEQSSVTELADRLINRIYAKSNWSIVTFFVVMIPFAFCTTFAMFGFAFTLTPIDFKCDLNNSNVYQNFSAELNSCLISSNATNRSIACPTKFQFIPDREFMQSSIISDFQLICKDSYLDELLFTVFIWSTTIGDLVSPFLFDKLGRQYILLGSNFVVSISGFAATFVSEYWLLVVCLTVMGFARQFAINAVYLLSLELMPAERLNLYGLLNQIIIHLSSALIGFLAFFFRDWKQLQIVSLSMGLLTPLLWFVVPESPRWLITTGKTDRLQATLRRYVQRFSSLTASHFEDLMTDIITHWNTVRVEKSGKPKPSTNPYLLVLRSKVLMGWIFILFYTYAYMSTSRLAVNSFLTLETVNKFLLYSSSALWDILYIVIIYLSPGNSRNVKMLVNQLLGAVSFSVIPFLPKHYEHLSFIFIMLGKATIMGTAYIVQTCAIYIYPSNVRGIGSLLPHFLSRIVSTAAPFLISQYDYNKFLPTLTIGIVALSVGWLNLLYPELLSNPIPETIHDAKQLRHNIGFAGCKNIKKADI